MGKTWRYWVSGGLAGIANGFFGGGGGSVLVPLLTRMCGEEQRQAFATSVAVILLRQFMDNTIHDKHDLQMHIDIPVLGEIPSFELATGKKKGGRTHA